MGEVNHIVTPVVGLNMRELLLGRPTRLRYVVRFSICPRVHDESVAEHSFYTAYFAMMIAQDLMVREVEVNGYEVASKALIHDMDETYSGDMIRMFKHSSPEIKDAMDKAAEGFMEQHSKDLLGHEGLCTIWKNAKSDNLEGAIVSLADFLSVLSYVVQEIQSGNHVMYEHLEDLKKFYESFHTDRYIELKEYIDQAGRIIFGMEARRIQIR